MNVNIITFRKLNQFDITGTVNTELQHLNTLKVKINVLMFLELFMDVMPSKWIHEYSKSTKFSHYFRNDYTTIICYLIYIQRTLARGLICLNMG